MHQDLNLTNRTLRQKKVHSHTWETCSSVLLTDKSFSQDVYVCIKNKTILPKKQPIIFLRLINIISTKEVSNLSPFEISGY